jgi:Resolvase, N terminal domain/Recombinase
MTTPEGEMMAHIMASFAQFERKLIGQRTKDALAQVKARGVRLGRPRRLPQEVLQRVSADREAGLTLQAIADRLTADGVPTAQGGAAWYPATVAAVLRSITLDTLAYALVYSAVSWSAFVAPQTCVYLLSMATFIAEIMAVDNRLLRAGTKAPVLLLRAAAVSLVGRIRPKED